MFTPQWLVRAAVVAAWTCQFTEYPLANTKPLLHPASPYKDGTWLHESILHQDFRLSSPFTFPGYVYPYCPHNSISKSQLSTSPPTIQFLPPSTCRLKIHLSITFWMQFMVTYLHSGQFGRLFWCYYNRMLSSCCSLRISMFTLLFTLRSSQFYIGTSPDCLMVALVLKLQFRNALYCLLVQLRPPRDASVDWFTVCIETERQGYKAARYMTLLLYIRCLHGQYLTSPVRDNAWDLCMLSMDDMLQ